MNSILMLRVFKMIFLLSQAVVGSGETKKQEYDCSSYFMRSLADDGLVNRINKISEENCKINNRFEITDFVWTHTKCIITFEIQTFVEGSSEQQCYDSFNDITKNAIAYAWGMPWGCEDGYVETLVSQHYSIIRPIKGVRTIMDSVSVETACNFLLIQANKTFYSTCKMNTFGGYNWVQNEMSGCFVHGLDDTDTKGLVVNTVATLKGHSKCQLLYLIFYGRLKSTFESNEHISVHLDAIRLFIKDWEHHCTNLPFTEHMSIRNFIFETFEMCLNQIVKKSVNEESADGNQFFVILFEMAKILVFHSFNCEGFQSSTTWSSNFLHVIHYSQKDLHSNSRQQGNDTVFSLVHGGNLLNVSIVCFGIKRHQRFIAHKDLKPISDVCIVGVALWERLKINIKANFKYKISFKIEKIEPNKQSECAIMHKIKENMELKLGICETIYMVDMVNCVCSTHGAVFVSEATINFTNLKTILRGAITAKYFFIFICFILAVTVIGILQLFFIISSRKLRKLYRTRQDMFAPNFRDFSIIILGNNLGVIIYILITLKKSHESSICTNFLGGQIFTWTYMTHAVAFSYTLCVVLSSKTHNITTMMRNILVINIGISLIVTTIIEYNAKQHFLNYGCIATNTDMFYTYPAICVSSMNLFILCLYIAKKSRRYMDEWIGCLVFILGDLLTCSLRSFIYFETDPDEKLQLVTYHLIGTALKCFLITVYQMFLKISMVIFYHRMYCVFVQKIDMETVLNRQNRGKMFSKFNFGATESKSQLFSPTSSRNSSFTSSFTSDASSLTEDSHYSGFSSSKMSSL